MDKHRLAYEMKRKGYTAQSLCEKIGISRTAFYRKCNGTSEFTRSEIEKIVSVLGIPSPDAIFFPQKVS